MLDATVVPGDRNAAFAKRHALPKLEHLTASPDMLKNVDGTCLASLSPLDADEGAI